MEERTEHVHSTLHDHGHDMDKILVKMPADEQFFTVADIFAQLCDSTRLRILWLLCHSEVCVSDIAIAIGMSAPAVSHHLRTLKQTGLIVGRREGKEVLYTLANTKKAGLVHNMVDDIFEMNCRANGEWKKD